MTEQEFKEAMEKVTRKVIQAKTWRDELLAKEYTSKKVSVTEILNDLREVLRSYLG